MTDTYLGFVYGLFIGSFLFLSISMVCDSFEIREFKAIAIENGYAEYDSKTGEWQWKK